ncbi:MAG: lytic murein transglycosylase [Sphingopyxis sp.]
MVSIFRSILLCIAFAGALAAAVFSGSGGAIAQSPALPTVPAPVPAINPENGYQAYVRSLRQKALDMGVRPATFDRITATLSYNPRVVELDRSQIEVRANSNAPISLFAPYRVRHVDAARIAGGQAVYVRERAHLASIEARTGVPAGIILGIYGHETNYGRITGNFDLLRSLSTLAFDGRRRNLFEAEFLSAMVMIERGAPREALIGSWAGAIGHPQFLPSVYLRLARDGDGDGVAAIWNNQADAMASIAHYLQVAGYKRGEHWGYAVSVPGGLNRASIVSPIVSPRCPRVFQRHSRWLTADEWRARGVVFNGRAPDGDVMLSLLEPDGEGRTAYLLTGSYRAILDYNCSNFYALSVGLLSDAIVS